MPDLYVDWLARRIVGYEDRKFNPLQPRDPGGEGGGQWIRDPSAIFRKLFKFGGQSVAVVAHDNGDRTISMGGRSVRLTSGELNSAGIRPGGYGRQQRSLRSLAFDAVDWEPGQGDALSRIEGVERPRSRLLVGVKKVSLAPSPADEFEESWDQDILSLHLPESDDDGFDELMASAGVHMRQRDVVTLAETADEMIAERVDTGNGQVDMFRDGGRMVIRPVGGHELVLDRKSAIALDRAIDKLIDDEYRDPRPDTKTEQKVVPTKLGDVTVSITGEYNDGPLVLTFPDGTVITLPAGKMYDFLQALGDLAGTNS